MLVKLTPENVFHHWKLISFAIQQSLPPITIESPKRLTKILEGLLSEKLQCWSLVENPEGYAANPEIYLIATTSLVTDDITEVKSLMIYSGYGFKKIPRKMMADGIETLKTFAEGNDCCNIVAYAKLGAITRHATSFGAKHDFDFITIPLGNGA